MEETRSKMTLWHSFIYHTLVAGVPTIIIFIASVLGTIFLDQTFRILTLISIPVALAFSLRADDIFAYFLPKYRKNLL